MRKTTCRATQPYLITILVCAVFSFDHTTGCEAYSFTTDGDGRDGRAHKCGCVPYTQRGSGIERSAQELTRRDRKQLHLTLPRQGIELRVFGFEFRLSNHRATSPIKFIDHFRSNRMKGREAVYLYLIETTFGIVG